MFVEESDVEELNQSSACDLIHLMQPQTQACPEVIKKFQAQQSAEHENFPADKC